MRVLLVALGLSLLPGLAGAEGSRRYDAAGRYLGRSERSGDTTKFYDSKGRYSGRATRSGAETRRYDSKGAYIGRSERGAEPRR